MFTLFSLELAHSLVLGAIEGVTGASSSRKQLELIIPVADLEQAQKKQVEQKREALLQGGATSEESSEEKRETTENLEGQVKRANQLAESLNRGFRFFVHEDSGRLAIDVVDNNTNEVIKTIPPEQFLTLLTKVQKVVGIFLDEFV